MGKFKSKQASKRLARHVRSFSLLTARPWEQSLLFPWPDQLERNYVCRYDHKSIAMPGGNSANPLTCKPQGRQPLCKPCRQKKGSNCTYLVGEVSRRSVLPTKEIKSLWLDPSVFKTHGHEIKELPLSPGQRKTRSAQRRRPVLTREREPSR